MSGCPPNSLERFFFSLSDVTLLLTLMVAWQFQNGARGLRSEIVSNLKQHALLIFEINDIEVDKFLHQDSRDQSTQLKGLSHNNAFLFASPCDLPGIDKIRRYYRSRCISRVSSLIFLWITQSG